jgi:hypothetical protein
MASQANHSLALMSSLSAMTPMLVPRHVSVGTRASSRRVPGLLAAAASALLVACVGRAASPLATATPDTRSLQALLPSDFGSVGAHRFAVGPDMLARLTAELGVAPGDLEVAFASDHGPALVQEYAIRPTKHSAEETLAALALVAYPDARETTTATEQQMGMWMVTVISEPTEAARLGTLYCIADGQVLIVAQAFAEAVADAAFAEPPSASSRD